MKTRLSLILTALIAGIAATSARAGCDSTCPPGACRYESAGNRYYCTAVRSKAPGATVGPRANGAASSTVVQKGPASPTGLSECQSQLDWARNPQCAKTKPKAQMKATVQAPRDAASGLATGRRQHLP